MTPQSPRSWLEGLGPVWALAGVFWLGFTGLVINGGVFALHGEQTEWKQLVLTVYFPCLLIGGLVSALPGLQALSVPLILLGAAPICVLYAYLAWLPFRVIAHGLRSPGRRGLVMGGILLLGVYGFFIARIGRDLHARAHPTPAQIARLEVHKLADLMDLYKRWPGGQTPGTPADLSAILQRNRGRHGSWMKIDPDRLSPESREYRDPWGTAYRLGWGTNGVGWVYSPGPDGRDDGGQGDDIPSWEQ